jgi:hypothetical protein
MHSDPAQNGLTEDRGNLAVFDLCNEPVAL